MHNLTHQGLCPLSLPHTHALLGRGVLAVFLLVVGLLGTAAFYLRAAPPPRSCSTFYAERNDMTTRRAWIPQIALGLLTPLVLRVGTGAAHAVVSAFLPSSTTFSSQDTTSPSSLIFLSPTLSTGPGPSGHEEGSGVREMPESVHLLLPKAQGRECEDALGLPARLQGAVCADGRTKNVGAPEEVSRS
jgi:hypothetical protein